MLATWFGQDRTIDLKAWAVALGLRHAYLDTLPGLHGTVYAIVLDADGSIGEILSITLNEWTLALKHLPFDWFPSVQPAGSDLNTKLAAIRSQLHTEPPVLCAVVLDRYAASQAALAAVAGHRRGSALKAQLLAACGTHWVSWAVNALVQDLTMGVLTGDLDRQLQRLAGWLEDKTVVFHRDGLPETRNGVCFQDRFPHLVATGELASVPAAIWVDERLVGQSLALIAHWLQQPGQVDAKPIYRGLASLLKQGYVRYAPSKTLRYLPWFPTRLGAYRVRKWLSLPPSSPLPAMPECTDLTLALCLSITEPAPKTCSAQETDIRQRCSQLLDTVARCPNVRVTVACAERLLRALVREAPDLLGTLRQRVANGQIEIAHSLRTRPLPMFPTDEIIRAELATSQDDDLPTARGIVMPDGMLSPGWSNALGGYNYDYLAIPEAEIHRMCEAFDLSRPISVEGWSVLALHAELGRALLAGADLGALAVYLRHLSLDHQGQTLAAELPLEHLDMTWLDHFLGQMARQGLSFAFLSQIADARTQGVAHVGTQFVGMEQWAGNEPSRQLNVLCDRLWEEWTNLQGLQKQALPTHLSTVDLARTALAMQRTGCRGKQATAAEQPLVLQDAHQALQTCQALVRQGLSQLGAPPPLPHGALGWIRVFEPRDIGRYTRLFQVEIPLPDGIDPAGITFFQHDVPVDCQPVECRADLARFWLALDIPPDEYQDLFILPYAPAVATGSLDITPSRLCNPWVAVLLDKQGQITSVRYQGQEWLCKPSNIVRGRLMENGQHLQPDQRQAEIMVTRNGPLVGALRICQTFDEDIQIVRHLALRQTSPIIECTTELILGSPQMFVHDLVIGEFGLAGSEASWNLPLNAGRVSVAVEDVPSTIMAVDDTIDVHTNGTGLRYMVHRATTRTYCYVARPLAKGLELGLLASTGKSHRSASETGILSAPRFPGHSYAGRYAYRYALLPLSADRESLTTAYNHAPLWAFYDVPSP